MNQFHADKQKLQEEVNSLRKEVRIRTISFITAALAFVAGFAWNDAIRSLVEHFFPANNGGLYVKFIYAGIVTLILVLITFYLERFFRRFESDNRG